MYKGTIVENSLTDKSILDKIKVEKTWREDDWILHSVLLTKEQISEVGKYLNDGPWYVHFWQPGDDGVIVMFRDKNFEISYSDKSTWVEAVEHGRSLGIPEEQLDFLIG